MTLKEKKEQDRKREEEFGKIIDSKFYFYVCNGWFRNTVSLEHQYKGIDAWITLGNQRMLTVDEKASLNWKGRKLETFALSLSNYDSSGNYRIGWFLDSSQVNDGYVFSWLDNDNDYTFSMVRKEDIQNYLLSIGWNYTNLIQKDSSIRNGDTNYGDITTNGIRFSYLPQYPEKDLNILLSRDTLINLSQVSLRNVDNKPCVLKSVYPIYL